MLQYSIFVSLYVFCNTICILYSTVYTVQYTLLWPRTFGLAYFGYFLPVWPRGLAHLATFYRVPGDSKGKKILKVHVFNISHRGATLIIQGV